MTIKTALVALLRRTIDTDRYPLSPRIGTLRRILAKLDPSDPAPAPSAAAEGVCPATAQRNAAEGSVSA